MDTKKLNELVKSALPEYSNFIEKHGPACHYYLLEPLEQRILDELKNMLEGAEADAATVANAKRILRAADELQMETAKPGVIGEGIRPA